MKYIDAYRLRAEIDRRMTDNLKADSEIHSTAYFAGAAKEDYDILSIIASLLQEQPEGIEGVVHHYATIHYLETNTEQLNARLKDFEEGARVRVFINTRKEDKK